MQSAPQLERLPLQQRYDVMCYLCWEICLNFEARGEQTIQPSWRMTLSCWWCRRRFGRCWAQAEVQQLQRYHHRRHSTTAVTAKGTHFTFTGHTTRDIFQTPTSTPTHPVERQVAETLVRCFMAESGSSDVRGQAYVVHAIYDPVLLKNWSHNI